MVQTRMKFHVIQRKLVAFSLLFFSAIFNLISFFLFLKFLVSVSDLVPSIDLTVINPRTETQIEPDDKLDYKGPKW